MKLYLIGDTETASLQGGVAELAWLWIDETFKVYDAQCYRVNPQRKIEPEAQAIHGISDADVADCPTLKQVTAGFKSKVDMIGHNISFDLRMLHGTIPVDRSLCTLNLAWRYISGVPSHKLEVLQKVLNFPMQKAHSALGDVFTCRDLLMHLCEITGCDIEGLFARQATPMLMTTMPFGKYKGQLITNVPTGYREWLIRQDLTPDLAHTLQVYRGITTEFGHE